MACILSWESLAEVYKNVFYQPFLQIEAGWTLLVASIIWEGIVSDIRPGLLNSPVMSTDTELSPINSHSTSKEDLRASGPGCYRHTALL